jgi:AcrR family transcriptional regulator
VSTEQQASPGRRARKKAATRAAIADAALALFLEHGFEGVSIRQIAEAADVSVATVFVHFPSKEALIFDEDAGFRSDLQAAVTGRPAGQDLLSALETFARGTAVARHAGTPEFETFRALVDRTPELRDFGRRAWTQHAAALADTITEDAARRGQPVDPVQAGVLARFVLESLDLASVSPDPGHTLAAAFTLLRQGWPDRR